MPQKALVCGTSYEVVSGRDLAKGTGYEIEKGRTLVEGTGYDIDFGIPIGELAVGEKVYTAVDGIEREFIIVNQGVPRDKETLEPSPYYSNVNGTWVMMKDIYDLMQYDWTDTTGKVSIDYDKSTIRSYLENTFAGLLKPRVASRLMTANIPFEVIGKGYFGYADCRVFILSSNELGDLTTNAMLEYFRHDGDYAFENAEKLIAYYGGVAHSYFTRGGTLGTHRNGVSKDGHFQSVGAIANGVRPAMILPFETRVTRRTHRII